MTGLSVELCDLTKVFAGERGGSPDVPAVRGVNPPSTPGEFFTFWGLGLRQDTPADDRRFRAHPREVFIRRRYSRAALPPAVNYVFQGYALFPHLTVGQNVAFAWRSRVPRAGGRRVREALEMVRLPGVSAQAGATFRRPAAARGAGPRVDQRARRAPSTSRSGRST